MSAAYAKAPADSPWPDLEPVGESIQPSDDGHRHVNFTPASEIKVRPVHWLWKDRVATGTLALVAGREGVGKSTLAYTLAADLTRGRLEGIYKGTPKSVIVAATEDSWEHTIAPRLMAANADLERIFRVDVTTGLGFEATLVLPKDLDNLEGGCRDLDAGMILLDPLMSRLSANLDTHKDAEVRQALEPLVKMADRAGVSILGLIHLNKSSSNNNDALNMVMGSKAFAAVARAVLFIMRDPDDAERILLGSEKNNLGRLDLPTLTYRITGAKVADTDEGPVWTGKVIWGTDSERTIQDALNDTGQDADVRTAIQDAADWLRDYLASHGGTVPSADAKAAAKRQGHAEATLKRAAKQRLKVVTTPRGGFQGGTDWALPGTQPKSDHSSRLTHGESAPTDLTEPTEPTESSQRSRLNVRTLQGHEPTEDQPHLPIPPSTPRNTA